MTNKNSITKLSSTYKDNVIKVITIHKGRAIKRVGSSNSKVDKVDVIDVVSPGSVKINV